MNPEDVGRILDEIGKRIGPAGEYAWTLAVRWQVTAGLVGLALGLVGIAVTVGLATFIWKKTEDADSFDRPLVRAFTLAFAIGFTAALLVVVADSSLRLLNPEYAALRELLKALP